MTTKSKKEVLEISVIFPEETLKENPELAIHYDIDKKILSYDISENIPKNSKDELKDILENSQNKELVLFNPVIESLMELQSFKDFKYDPEKEKETVDQFKLAKKTIGSFNSSITKVKSILKKPHIDYNKKVETIFKFLKQESDNTKGALEVNYDPYLKEQKRIKDEKEAKKKEEELAKIAELSAANKEQEEKLANQKRATKKLEIEAAINKITFEVNTKVPTLNLEGLETLKKSIENNNFDLLVSKEDGYSEEDYNTFKAMHTLNKESAIRVIEISINGINDAKAKENLQNEKAVLEAKTPASLIDGDNDLPFSETKEDKVPFGNTDLDKFKRILELLGYFNSDVSELISKITETEFEDDSLTKIKSILTEKSLPQVKEWSSKLVDWTSKKVSIYEQFLNNSNQ